MSRRSVLLIALALLGVAAVPLTFGGRPTLARLGAFPPLDLTALLALAACAALARALKQCLLLSRLGLRLGVAPSLAVSLATEAAFALTPAGAGGYPASIGLLRRAGIPLPAAMATTVADPLLDGLFFAIAMPLAATSVIDSGAARGLRELAWATAIAWIVGVALALLAWRPLRRLAVRLRSRSGHGLPRARRRRRWLAVALRLARALRRLARGGPRFLLGALVLTASQWCARYAILWLILDRLGVPQPFALLFLLQALVLHLAQWTGLPAGAGGAEIGLGLALASRLSAPTLAAALLLWRLGTLFLPVCAGALALLVLGRPRTAARSAAADRDAVMRSSR